VKDTWNFHQTLVSKFGEWFQNGKAVKLEHRSLVSVSNMEMSPKLWCQSLVMDAIWKAKCLMPKKVWCKIFGMLTVLTKIWHQILNDPPLPKRNSNINSTSFTNILGTWF
jgi:hypothetical protein